MTIRVALIGRGMAGAVFHAPLIGAVPTTAASSSSDPADAREGLRIIGLASSGG